MLGIRVSGVGCQVRVPTRYELKRPRTAFRGGSPTDCNRWAYRTRRQDCFDRSYPTPHTRQSPSNSPTHSKGILPTGHGGRNGGSAGGPYCKVNRANAVDEWLRHTGEFTNHPGRELGGSGGSWYVSGSVLQLLRRVRRLAASGESTMTRNSGYSNPTLQLLTARASCRSFAQRPVPEELLRQVLEAGVHAPTAGNLQPYSIIKIENLQTRQRLAELCGGQRFN